MDDTNKLLQQEKTLAIEEVDVLAGMRELSGYIDMTPHDFTELYTKVYSIARERILREMTAAKIMESPVITVSSSSSLSVLIRLLAAKAISGVPVVDAQGVLVGIVSEKDILSLLGKHPDTRLMQLLADSAFQALTISKAVLATEVQTIMSSPPIAALPDATLKEVVQIFQEKTINRLPILQKNGAPVGIITRATIISALSKAI